jgi:hypothetical protein
MDDAGLLQCGLTEAAAFSQFAIPHENLCDDGCSPAMPVTADPQYTPMPIRLWKVSDRDVCKAPPF